MATKVERVQHKDMRRQKYLEDMQKKKEEAQAEAKKLLPARLDNYFHCITIKGHYIFKALGIETITQSLEGTENFKEEFFKIFTDDNYWNPTSALYFGKSKYSFSAFDSNCEKLIISLEMFVLKVSTNDTLKKVYKCYPKSYQCGPLFTFLAKHKYFNLDYRMVEHVCSSALTDSQKRNFIISLLRLDISDYNDTKPARTIPISQ